MSSSSSSFDQYSKKHASFLEDMFNNKNPSGKHLGVKLKYNSIGQPEFTLPYNINIEHALHAIHGGIIAYLLDCAIWFAAAIFEKPNVSMVTSDLSIHYLRPAMKTNLRAIGQVIKRGQSNTVAEAKVYDSQNKLVAHAVGTIFMMRGFDVALKKSKL